MIINIFILGKLLHVQNTAVFLTHVIYSALQKYLFPFIYPTFYSHKFDRPAQSSILCEMEVKHGYTVHSKAPFTLKDNPVPSEV